MPSVTAIVPTHDRVDVLARALESLFQLSRPDGHDFEVVVVANACSDATAQRVVELARTAPFPLRLVEEPLANLNVARNRGVESSKSDILALLDDDVTVHPEWLEGLLEGFATTPAGVLAGRVDLCWEEVERPSWLTPVAERLLSRTDYGDQILEVRSGNIVGANFAFRRPVFDQLGGFVAGLDRTGTDLLSGGDTEFVQRALAARHRVFYCPRMGLRHWVAPHRVTLDYLEAVARSRGRTAVALANLRGNQKLVRLLLRGILNSARGLAAEGVARLKRDRPREVEAILYRRRAEGLLAAAGRQLMARFGAATDAL